MRRSVLMPVVALLAVCLMPLGASAGTAEQVSAGSVATPARPFTLGGSTCSLIDVPTRADAANEGAMPVGVGTCPGVRPGGELNTEVGVCTLNFLFTTPEGERFIGTAGHCILGDGPVADNAGEKTWPKGEGPVAKDGDGTRIGEFAYAILQEPKDFALIRLDPGVEASPEMCNYGGPTGINNEISGETQVLHYFGNGVAIGMTVPARSAIALGFPDPNHVYAAGLALPGDSGSAVITDDGQAVGVLVTTGVHGLSFSDNGIDFGTVGITRLVPQVEQAQKVLGLQLTLVTAGQ